MKFQCNNFNPETGESVVILTNKYGTYVGTAKVHPDDKYKANEITGCVIAEERAWINSYKKEKARIKIALKTMQDFKKDILKYYNPDKKLMRRVNLKIKNYSAEIEYLEKQIKTSEEGLKFYLSMKDKIT